MTKRVVLATYYKGKKMYEKKPDCIRFSVPREWLENQLNLLSWGTIEDYLLECTYDDNAFLETAAINEGVFKYSNKEESIA